MKTIVVSAVNIRKGGTLTILRGCLEYLSALALDRKFRVVALVHKRELCNYKGIEYIEMPTIIKGWSRRLWCEYVTMYRISKKLAPVDLWLSLHDTTPRVEAKHRAVYCQTSFPFLKLKLNDWRFDFKIGLFRLFTQIAYRINIRKNDYLIVQAEWLRKRFTRMFRLPHERFIIAPPSRNIEYRPTTSSKNNIYTFIYVATPDCHKNFELICQAAKLLEDEIGENQFKVILTINGTENKYAQWIHRQWGKVRSLVFHGLMDKETLFHHYATSDCLIFPSRIETWGLPITEFMPYNKPMLLADLPYAHETAAGANQVAFFNPESQDELKMRMLQLIYNDTTSLQNVSKQDIQEPKAMNWSELFARLIAD